MRPLNAIFAAAFTITGCQPTDCADGKCGEDPLDPRIAFDPGFDEAKRELESDGVRVPEDSDKRVTDEIERDLRERCDVIAYMAARWSIDGTSYDGVILNRRGRAVADIDGRFAPHRDNQGVFAGGYTVAWGLDDDMIEPEPVRPDTGDEDREADRDEWKSSSSSEPTEPTEPSPAIKGTMGGHYRGSPQTFAGTISRGTDNLPVRGMWQSTDRRGGYALGAVLECTDDRYERPIDPEVEPEPILVD